MFKKTLLLMLLMTLLVPWAANAQTKVTETFDFEDGQVPSAWTNDGTYPWVITSTSEGSGHTGTYCLKSGNTGVNSSSSTISATFTFVSDGSISFLGGCWGEGSNWDVCVFKIDGTTQFSYGNRDTWETYSFDVGAGDHTFTWSFTKDSSVAGTGDAFFVDDVVVDLGTAGALSKPTDLAVSNVTNNSATLNWTENGTATSWQICVNDNEANLINTSTKPYELTGLTATTAYTVKVRSVAGSNTSAWTNNVSFNTTAVAEAVGDAWSDDFEGTSCGWDLINGSLLDAWVWGTATNNGGTHSLYISDDGGTTNNYSHNSVKVLATKLLSFADGKYTFSYDWNCYGESSYDFLRVALVPGSQTLTAGSDYSTITTTTLPSGWIALDGGKLNQVSAWENKEVTIDVTAGNYYLVLVWRSDSSTQNNPPAAVDNVSITKVACAFDVTNLAVTDITTISAKLNWNGGGASQWQVAYSTNSNFSSASEITIDKESYDMIGLTSATTYYARVRAYCGGTDFGAWSSVLTFNTECESFTAYPYTENFDSYTGVTSGTTNNLPVCWNYINTSTYNSYKGYPVIYNASSYSHSTANHLRFSSLYSSYSNYDPQDQYAILPAMDDLAGKQITLYARAANTNSSYKIGTISNVNDASTFHVIATEAPTTSYEEYTYLIPNTCTDSHVAIMIEAATSSATSRTVYIDDIIIAEPPACLTPTGLTATTDGATATATWTGTATAYNIDINGTVTNNVTSPYQFPVALSTDYTIKVQANCGSDGTSDWSNTFSFTTPPCVGGHIIEYTLNDSYGDGWNGNAINVVEGCGNIIETLTIDDGSSLSGTLNLCGDYYEFVWVMGDYASETSFTFSEGGTTLFTKPSSVSDGLVLYTIGTQSCPKPSGLTAGTPGTTEVALSWTENGSAGAWQICINGDESNLVDANTNPFTLTGLTPDTDYTVKVRAACSKTEQSCWSDEVNFTTAEACAKPTGLTESGITTTSATMSWTGTSGSYVLQYRPWFQVGEDQQSTATFKTYTYDLSGFKGQGSIAIRHYDVSDKFYLNVDNVELRASDNSVVFSEGFESGSIPSTWTNYDVDGDGYTWDMASSANMSVIGNYGVYSASWISGVGALNPDNWLIISNVPMGGTFSFQARGQDPNFPDENFAVYVSLESDITEIPLTTTSYTADNLTPGTPYAWQVKSDCGMYQSNWTTSLFKTKDDVLIFATDGDWDDLSNWTDVDGLSISALPTTNNKVRIDADALVPAGVIATAGKTTINGGSITIEDGGQLKHNSATLWVTMEKEITGYGAGNEENRAGWYLISTPFSGSTEIEGTGTWSRVNNLASGTYDLYGFDSSEEGEAWINYEANGTHAVFTAGNNNGLVFKRGYLYASETTRTVTFEGTISKTVNNSMTEAYTYDNTSTIAFNGVELVGNPFSCNTYINYVDDGDNVLSADFYTMNAAGDGFELSSSNVALPPLTGAFIQIAASGNVKFSTEAPSSGSKPAMVNMSLVQNDRTVDQARVRFGRGFNLQHMSFRDDNAKLYIPQDNKDYAVVYAEQQGEMPLNFKAAENGTYTLCFNNENVEFGYLHLIDNLTGNDVDLLATPSYTFDAQYTDYASRFKLVFATSDTSDDQFAFISNGEIILSGVNGNTTVQLFDVTGRMISSTNGANRISTENMAAGVYMLRLVNGSDVKTQKIVVK